MAHSPSHYLTRRGDLRRDTLEVLQAVRVLLAHPQEGEPIRTHDAARLRWRRESPELPVVPVKL